MKEFCVGNLVLTISPKKDSRIEKVVEEVAWLINALGLLEAEFEFNGTSVRVAHGEATEVVVGRYLNEQHACGTQANEEQ